MIHSHHHNETPKLSLDVLGGTFEIAKTVLALRVSECRQFIYLDFSQYEYVQKKRKLSYFDILEKFHTTPFRQINFNGTIVQ